MLEWEPERLGFAAMCLEYADAQSQRAIKKAGMVVPAFVMNP